MTARRFPLIIWLLLLFLSRLPIAHAQNGISRVQTTADYRYGQVMTFRLQADSERPITRVTLAFSTPTLPNTFTADIPLTPTQSIAVTQTVDLTQVHIAPFASVTFWWTLTDANGDVYTLPESSLLYADDRFRWQALEREGVVIHWAEGDPVLAQTALDVVAQARPRLQAIIPAAWPAPLHVYLYPTSSDLRAALLLAGSDWVGGHASPSLGVVLVTAADPITAPATLRRSLPHELTHWLLYQATSSSYDTMPAWFGEGLATWFEENPNPNYAAILQQAVSADQTLPFQELCLGFPTSENDALLAYAQSASLVATIQARYGNHALTELIAAFGDGLRCEAAVQQVLGISMTDLTQIWRRAQQQQTPLQRYWLQNRAWLLLLLGGFLLTGLLVVSGTGLPLPKGSGNDSPPSSRNQV